MTSLFKSTSDRAQIDSSMEALIEARVAMAVEAHLADLFPQLQADAVAAAQKAIPHWLREIPIKSTKEFATAFVEKYCADLCASVDEKTDAAVFYRDGVKVPFPIGFVRDFTSVAEASLKHDPFAAAYVAGKNVVQNAISPPAGQQKYFSFESALGVS